jgi:hypothetical protein
VFAAKACLLTGPPTSLRGSPSGPWHRYKDLFDLYFMTRAVPLQARQLQDAVEGNWNFDRMDRDGLPVPYRLFGDATRPGDGYTADEAAVPWEEGCRRLQAQHPQLVAYPAFAQMSQDLGTCLDSAPGAVAGASWAAGRWVVPTATTRGQSDAVPFEPLSGDRRSNAERPASGDLGSGGVRCSVCGRPLHADRSVADGVGPTCRGRG